MTGKPASTAAEITADGAGEARLPAPATAELCVPAVMPQARSPVAICLDCKTWRGPSGSAHDPAACPRRGQEVARLRDEIAWRRQRLADITGEPS